MEYTEITVSPEMRAALIAHTTIPHGGALCHKCGAGWTAGCPECEGLAGGYEAKHFEDHDLGSDDCDRF